MAESIYDSQHIEQFYDKDPEREWRRLVESPVEEIKLHIHNHYLHQYLTPGMRVLEIGAGPGRFTQTLHALGCSVVVADISSAQLELNRKKAAELRFDRSVERWVRMDICDMAEAESGAFDAVVAYGGPISYVFERADQAVAQCRRVLKSGGRLLTSVMSLWGTMQSYIGGIVRLPVENNRQIISTGNLTAQTNPYSDHYCHMFRAAELKDLLQNGGFELLALSASNGLATNHPDLLETIRTDETVWNALLEWELEACRSPGLVEAGTHMIAVAEKG